MSRKTPSPSGKGKSGTLGRVLVVEDDPVQGMAIEQACQIPFAKINAHRFAEVQRLLGKPGPIDPLEPPAS